MKHTLVKEYMVVLCFPLTLLGFANRAQLAASAIIAYVQANGARAVRVG